MTVYRDGVLARSVADEARDAKRHLLGRLRVASPCSEPWANMLGDDRVRFCHRCAKDLFDVSAMTRAEAEDFVAKAIETNACVKFFQRADGTIITGDCPEGVAMKRRRLKVMGAVAGGLTLSMMACNAMSVQGNVSDEASMKVKAPIGASVDPDSNATQAVYK